MAVFDAIKRNLKRDFFFTDIKFVVYLSQWIKKNEDFTI